MNGVFSGLLRRIGDLVNSNGDKQEAKDVEERTQEAWVSWVSANDAATGRIRIGRHEFRLERMVDPLADANEHEAEKHRESVCVRNALQLDGQSCNGSGCSESHKHVIPVLNLQPGQRFIHEVPNV